MDINPVQSPQGLPRGGRPASAGLIPWVAAVLTFFVGAALAWRTAFHSAMLSGVVESGSTLHTTSVVRANDASREAAFFGAVAAYIVARVLAAGGSRLQGLLLGSLAGSILAAVVGFFLC
jgi:hypothetical protein